MEFGGSGAWEVGDSLVNSGSFREDFVAVGPQLSGKSLNFAIFATCLGWRYLFYQISEFGRPMLPTAYMINLLKCLTVIGA